MENSNDVQNTTNVGNEVLADVMARFILKESKDMPDGYEEVVFGLEPDFDKQGKQKLVMYTNLLKPLKVWWVNVP